MTGKEQQQQDTTAMTRPGKQPIATRLQKSPPFAMLPAGLAAAPELHLAPYQDLHITEAENTKGHFSGALNRIEKAARRAMQGVDLS